MSKWKVTVKWQDAHGKRAQSSEHKSRALAEQRAARMLKHVRFYEKHGPVTYDIQEVSKAPVNIVTAPVAGGAYPNSTKWNEITTRIHAVEIDATGAVVRVLCGKVKPESILDDSSLHNVQGVTCPVCLRRLLKLSAR